MTKIPLRVLYIEDSDVDAELVEAQLSMHEYAPQIHRIETAEEMEEALRSGPWDVILADFSLPRFNAVKALEILAKSGKDLPFIVVSGTIGEARALEMMKGGAQDFILKGDFLRLIPAIRREVNEAVGRQARRDAERALSISETSFKELADAMPQLVWTSVDGEVTYLNAKWREYFGSDERGRDWLDRYCHPDDVAEARRRFEEASRENKPYQQELRFRRKDGVYRWFLSRGIPSRDLSGQQRWFGTCTDIEDAKRRAEKEAFLSKATALLASSLDYQRTLANLAEIVVEDLAEWCTIDMIGEDGNPRTLAFAHRDRKKLESAREFQRKFPTDWNAPTGTPNVLRTGKSEIYPQISDELLARSVRTDEELRLIREFSLRSAMIVPLKYGDTVVGAISLLSTKEGRSYSKEDLEFAEELARRASSAIENAELYRRADSANRAKTDFLANMSHEIRTPLGAILGFAELLADPSQPLKDRLDCVSVIRRNGQQLSRLIDEILDLTKIEAARLELEKTEFSMVELLEDVSTLLSVQAEAKGVRLGLQYGNPLPARIVSDPTRTRQVLINLIGNAIKFTPRGEVAVHVRSHPSSSNDEEVIEFSVSDTGIGMTEAQAARLFQPFVQADSSMKRKFGGTGLGLALSRRLAESLGGSLALERTVPNVGSTFVFKMTATRVQSLPPQVADKLEPAVSQSSDRTSTVLAGRRILVVDDAPDNRVLVARYLTRVGAEVHTASDGEMGAEKALAGDYHVVLMDLQMPNVDGFQALDLLRAKGYDRPVIALTAHAMRGDRERCIEHGFSEHLSKPIDSRRLVEVVSAVTN